MAIETVRVGDYNDGAIHLSYDYDTADNKIQTIRYKNSDGLPCRFVIYEEPAHTVLFSHPLPANTPNILTRNIAAGQRPVLSSTMSISLDCGGFSAGKL